MKDTPLILAVETATDACSVALGDGTRIYRREAYGSRIHTQRLLPMIHEIVAEAGCVIADLTAIAVGRGPGSFTGVRIGVGLAQGLGFGLNIPVYPISTLAALACQGLSAPRPDQNIMILPMLDARMGEIYVGGYVRTGADMHFHAVIDEQLCIPEQLEIRIAELGYEKWHCIGSGWDRYRAIWEQQAKFSGIENRYPLAADVLALALDRYQQGDRGIPVLQLLPTYLRDNVAIPG